MSQEMSDEKIAQFQKDLNDYLCDQIGVRLSDRESIYNFIEGWMRPGVTPEKANLKENKIELDAPIEGQRPGESMVDYALRYRREWGERENRKLIENRKSTYSSNIKDIEEKVSAAFQGIRK